jgi:hypothetical protein
MPKDKSVDPLLDALLENLQKCGQVQYSTKDQLSYLHKFAIKFGLYDAADVIKDIINPPSTPSESTKTS